MVLIAEQPERPAPPSSPAEPPAADSRGTRRPTRQLDPGGEMTRRRGPDADLDPGPVPHSRNKTRAIRLKPVEPPLLVLSAADYETKFERKKPQPGQLSKTNAQYHKLFKEVSKDELLKQSYTCALQRDILYQGKMFVSDNWICFHSKVFGRDTKIAIPVSSVTFLKKTKTALLVPNALVIESANEQHIFVSFLSRNTTFKLLKSLCIHLEVDKVCSSPVISSCENSFRVRCPSPLPLDLSVLDGVVQQRHQEMMESSSSGSQTPDSDKTTDFPVRQGSFLSADVSVHADVLQSPSQKHGATLKNGSFETLRSHSSRLSLNVILFIYLFLVSVLVLSSWYMAFKIVALEHRFNSLLTMEERILKTHKPRDDASAEMHGEISTNLFKLEKIQRNLQKLLDET